MIVYYLSLLWFTRNYLKESDKEVRKFVVIDKEDNLNGKDFNDGEKTVLK